MTTSVRALTFLVTIGFAVPALAGQAVPRTTTGSSSSSSSSSSSGSSGSGGGSSSSSSGEGRSSGTSGSSSSGPTDASGRQMFSGGEFKSTHSRIPSSTATRTGTAEARRAPAPGGVATGGDSASSSSSRTGTDLFQGLGENGAVGRSRNGAPVTGRASARPVLISGSGDYVSFPFYGPWGNWYPWYGGFGWNIGFVAYNPWYYGATRWYWGPYGMWYDPFMYDPFYYGGGYAGGGGDDYTESKPREPKKTTGSLRIKANPSSASVYIDGALVGTVEEFSGLNDRLEIEGGRHMLEVRAEGYVPKSEEVNVKVGTTQTVRINLKKK